MIPILEKFQVKNVESDDSSHFDFTETITSTCNAIYVICENAKGFPLVQ